MEIPLKKILEKCLDEPTKRCLYNCPSYSQSSTSSVHVDDVLDTTAEREYVGLAVVVLLVVAELVVVLETGYVFVR